MTRRSISTSDATRRLLEIAREHMGMDVAWVSHFVDGQQQFVAVDTDLADAAPAEGDSALLRESYCVRVLDGRLPAVVPDSTADLRTRDLAVTRELGIGAYAGSPIRSRDGAVLGMLCVTSRHASPELVQRDLRVMEMLAQVIGELTGDDDDSRATAALTAQVQALVRGEGRRHVLQPIVDVRTGVAVGYEALSRFDVEPSGPDVWFARAESVGLRRELELAAAADALRELDHERAGYLSINLSPDVVCDADLGVLLADVDLSRVVLEITEHAQIADYTALVDALAPYRALGLRVAIDDAGAGYASFRHILQVAPELIKADLSLVRGVDEDPVRQALVASLLLFARTAGARLVAEGVETQAELDTLARLGVTTVQGYLLGRPTEQPAARDFARPSPHVHVDAAADLPTLLAEAVRDARDLESLARPLLDVVLRLTGLETAYVTVLEESGLSHRYVRNAGSIALPEGFVLPWSDSLCAAMRAQDLLWTGQAQGDLAECGVAAEYGLQTFLSIPVLGRGGELLGTLCAGSTDRTFISDGTLAQVRLVAHVLGGRVTTTVSLPA